MKFIPAPRLVLSLFLAAMCLLAPGRAAANLVAINEPLRVVESEHFIFVYQKSLEAQVPNLVKSFEDAFALLTPVFNCRPEGKIYVLYDDSWDEHNGFATIFPRPVIAVFAGDVSPGSSIYEPGNFIRGTVFHEMAHLLPMTTQYGLGKVLTAIFGRAQPVGDFGSIALAILSIPPNALAPEWYLEGLSIWSETEFVGPGRGRSSIADMIMRMPVADDRLLRPSEWSLQLPEHPYGEAAYLYGMRAIQYVHEKYGVPRGTNAPGAAVDSVAHSFLYFFDKRARRVTGETFGQIAENAMQVEKERQAEHLRLLESVPVTEVKKLTPDRLQATRPKFGPGGDSIYFTANGEAERDTLYRYDLESGSLAKVGGARVQEGITRLAPSPDRRSLYYTRLNYRGRDRVWNELRRYDTGSGWSHKITSRGRYRYPAISPDGKKLAAVRNAAGTRVLLEVPIRHAGRARSERKLAEAPEFHQIVDPLYSPDGEDLLYLLASRERTQIRRVDLKSGKDSLMLDWPCLVMSPAFHPSGKELVFSADRNGVYNLYRMDFKEGAEPEAITHVVGGMFTPDFSPDGTKLAASCYDSYGYHLAVLDYEGLKPVGQPLPEIPERWETLPSNQEKVKALEAEPPPAIVRSRPYLSLLALRPDFWTPWLMSDEDGSVGGVAASFSDPAGLQNIFLMGGYDTAEESPVASAVWQYSGKLPIFSLYGTYTADSYADLLRDTNDVYYNYSEQVGAGGVAVTLPFESVDRQVYLSLGYQYADRRMMDESEDDLEDVTLVGTNDAPLYEGGEGAVWGTLEFFNGTAFGRSMSVEDGRYLFAGIEQSAEALGGELTRTRVLGMWNEYLPTPWDHNHVLKLSVAGGTGSGDEIAQGFFGIGGFDSAQVSSTPGMPRNLGLRGYDENYQVGKNVVKAGASYRFPIWRMYRGATATLPLYFQQLFAEFFYEGGMAWGSEPEGAPDNEWLNVAGTEINFSTTLFRLIDIAPGVGIAYAFDREDRDRFEDDDEADDEEEDEDDGGDDQKLQVYISLKASINF